MTRVYPTTAAERDRWILNLRGPRNRVSPDKPYAFLVEEERFASGELGRVATIFLTNRECPWRCTMCDLWRNTLGYTIPVGAVPQQIEHALARLPAARQVKLYNSGSFFDPRAIPKEDYAPIAALVSGFERVIVECHPALIGRSCADFQQMLGTELEVAMGLETVHPLALHKLNKRMTTELFARAAERLHRDSIALRTFVLVHPPFVPAAETAYWTSRSVAFALRCRSNVVALIPTRPGNGAVEHLAVLGEFEEATFAALESALDDAIAQTDAQGAGARIFADVWDADRFLQCAGCRGLRLERVRKTNEMQVVFERAACSVCGQRP